MLSSLNRCSFTLVSSACYDSCLLLLLWTFSAVAVHDALYLDHIAIVDMIVKMHKSDGRIEDCHRKPVAPDLRILGACREERP